LPRAIDCWVNTSMGDAVPPEFLQRVAENYFKRADAIFKSFTPDELVAQMDAAGVEKAIVTIASDHPLPQVLAFPKHYPERFSLSVVVDPRRGMKAVRELEGLVESEPVVLARVTPFMVGGIAPNDYRYFPLYTKCIEWKLPGSINTADPWWNVAIRLMIKYANLHLMTSAYAPKYFPPELVHFMNTRGKHKILFASDHPVLDFARCIQEAEELPLRDGVLDRFLYENANQLFFQKGTS